MDENQRDVACANIDKQVVKEALKEWMNEQFASFGVFALRTIVVVAFTGLLWLYITTSAHTHPLT